MSEAPEGGVPPPLDSVDRDAVAAAHGVAGDSLRRALVRMQTDIRTYPGVADIVYEYRRAFARDPLAARVDDCYYLLVPSHVWPEFGTALSLDDAMLAAVKTVHARAFAACSLTADGRQDDDREPLLLIG